MPSEMTLAAALDRIRPVDPAKLAAVQARLDRQTKPRGSLGRLEELARRYAAITGREDIRRKTVFTFAGDHGVTDEGVSAFPREVTPQMVYNFLDGGAAINALARHAGAGVTVVDMGVDHEFAPREGLLRKKIGRGTRNIALGPAMSREEAVQLPGNRHRDRLRLPGGGDRPGGNGRYGDRQHHPLGRHRRCLHRPAGGGGHFSRHRHRRCRRSARKIEVIERALRVNAPDPGDPVDVLAKVGGFEIGGIAGLVLGCAAAGLPVVVDGFISTAGALIASELHPHVREYIFAAHQSAGDRPHRHAGAHRTNAPAQPGDAPRRRDRRGAGHGSGRGRPARPAGDPHLRGGGSFGREGRSMKEEWEDFRLAGGFPDRLAGRARPLHGAGAAGAEHGLFPCRRPRSGAGLVVVNWALSALIPRPVLDCLLVLILIAATGGLHLDGIADLIDGLAGGRNREGVLRIMKDSRVGAMGAVGLVMVLLLKYLSLYNIPLAMKSAALIFMPAAGRWIQVVLAAYLSLRSPRGGNRQRFCRACGGAGGADRYRHPACWPDWRCSA